MPRIPANIALGGGSDVVVDGVTTRGVFTHTPTINLIDEDVGQENQVRIASTVAVNSNSRIEYGGRVYEARGTTPSPDTGTTVVHLSAALFDTPSNDFPVTERNNADVVLLDKPDVVLENGRPLDSGDAAALGGWEVATRRGICARLTMDPDAVVSGDLFEWGDVVLSVTLAPNSPNNFVIRDGAGQVATWQQVLTDEITIYIGGDTLRRFAFFSNSYTLRNTRSFAAAAEGGGTDNPGVVAVDLVDQRCIRWEWRPSQKRHGACGNVCGVN